MVNRLSKDMTLVDMNITVGHIISNPYFDVCFNVAIVEDDEDSTPLFESEGCDFEDIPAELVIAEITYMTIADDKLRIYVHTGGIRDE